MQMWSFGLSYCRWVNKEIQYLSHRFPSATLQRRDMHRELARWFGVRSHDGAAMSSTGQDRESGTTAKQWTLILRAVESSSSEIGRLFTPGSRIRL